MLTLYDQQLFYRIIINYGHNIIVVQTLLRNLLELIFADVVFRTLFCSFQNNISKNITFVCSIEDKDYRWRQLEDTQSQNSYISALLKFVAWDFLIFRNFCGNWFLLRYLFEAERGYSLRCFYSRTAKFATFLPGKKHSSPKVLIAESMQ